MLDGRVLGASQVEYKPFGKPPLKRERRGLEDPLAANRGHVAARQENSLLQSQMQLGSLQYPIREPRSTSTSSRSLRTYDNTVRNIDIGRVGYLHSFIAGFPTERMPKMPLSGVSTRSGDLARFTMTDLFIHLVAYQLVTPSGTGVSVLIKKRPGVPFASFLMQSDTAVEVEGHRRKNYKKMPAVLQRRFWS